MICVAIALGRAPSATAAPVGAGVDAAQPFSTGAGRRLVLVPCAEFGIAKPIGVAAALFSAATDIRLSLSLGRVGSRWRLPVSLSYRRALDPSPADDVSSVGAWVYPEVTLLGRLIASVGVGWQWRHISIDGASSIRNSASAMWSLGVRFWPWPRVELTALAKYDLEQPVAGEQFRAQNLNVAVAIGFPTRQ